jgi:hypothetical protein
LQHYGNILGYIHMREQAHILDYIANASPELNGIDLRNVLVPDVDLALSRIVQAIDMFHQGGLSAPAGANQDR